MSYYTTQGFSVGTGGGGGKTDKNTEIAPETLDNSEEISKIRNSLTGMLSKVNGLANTVAQYENLPSRLNALTQVVNNIQANAITVVGYTDNSPALTYVYNTKYINAAFKDRVPIVYDDISKQIIASTKDCYSTNVIKSISNIMSIPTVYNNLKKTEVSTISPSVYSTVAIDKLATNIPTIATTRYTSGTGDDNKVVYTATYINTLSIPTQILSIQKDEPNPLDVYNAEYVNEVRKSIPPIITDLNNLVDREGSAYSTAYIDALPIPKEICDDFDRHISKNSTSDSTEQNIYNTYYIDRFVDSYQYSYNVNPRTVITMRQNGLMVRLYNEADYKKTANSGVYKETFGNTAKTYMLRPYDNNFVLSYHVGDIVKGAAGEKLLTITPTSSVWFKQLTLGDNIISDENMTIVDASRYSSNVQHINTHVGFIQRGTRAKLTGVTHDYYCGNNLRTLPEGVYTIALDDVTFTDTANDIAQYEVGSAMTNASNVCFITNGTNSHVFIPTVNFQELTAKSVTFDRLTVYYVHAVDYFETLVDEETDPENPTKYVKFYSKLLTDNKFEANGESTFKNNVIIGLVNNNTTLTVNSDSTFNAPVTTESTLTTNGELVANGNITLTSNLNGRHLSQYNSNTNYNGALKTSIPTIDSNGIISFGHQIIIHNDDNATYTYPSAASGRFSLSSGAANYLTLQGYDGSAQNGTIEVNNKILLRSLSNAATPELVIQQYNNNTAPIGTITLKSDGLQINSSKIYLTGNVIQDYDENAPTTSTLNDLNAKNIYCDTVTTTGDITIGPGGILDQQSDMRCKENVTEMNDDIIDRLKVYSFSYNNDETHKKHFGVIAQEVLEECPELVSVNKSNKMYTVNYIELIPHLIHRIQVLSEEQKTIKTKCKNKIDKLELKFSIMLIIMTFVFVSVMVVLYHN